MPEYQLQIKQVVDYPRCRIYREFIHKLINDRSIRIALLLMNFSRSGRTVDESRAWLKRICITWAILNGLGFIMAYVTPLFSGGQWTG